PEETEVDSGQVTSDLAKHQSIYRRLTRHRLYTLNFRRLGPRSLRSRDPRQRKFKVYKWCQTSPPCVVHR
ncbi:hypothetical protein TYRP_017671, partial [Tyrophagus putrescentiae]